MTAPAFRFPNVTCSQCAGSFGPGDSGFSDCREHQSRPANLDRKADEAIQRGAQIASDMQARLPGQMAAEDRATYFAAMVAGNVDMCVRIERRYGLYGYSPEVVSVGLNAAAEGQDVEDAVDNYLLAQEGCAS